MEYIELTPELGREALRSDVKKGAKQFAELAEFADRKPSQFVIINCSNKEEGLMAASYLAGCYNMQDGVEYDEDGENCGGLRDFREFDFEDGGEDFDEMNGNPSWNEPGRGGDNWEEGARWPEDPWRLPVIDSFAITGDSTSFPTFSGQFGMDNNIRRDGLVPFWHHTRKEPIIIMVDEDSCIFGGLGRGTVQELISGCRRFRKNRHVYIIHVHEEQIIFDMIGMDEEDPAEVIRNDELLELILEYSAGTVDVDMGEEERKKYNEIVFRSLVENYGYKLCKNFPIKRIMASIELFSNEEKNKLMDRVIRYLGKEERTTNVLTEQDFHFLKKFSHVCEMEKEKKSVRRFENEIVGMEDVKDQLMGIVEVMKYNKRRKDMGIAENTFHNVHMFLGAPGTAKTTMAELLGKMMAEQKLLKGSNFISINGAELKGQYVGQTAPKVKALFDQYDIIMIDEAYSLTSSMHGEMDIFAQEAMAQLMLELEKHGTDRLVLFAGYGGKKVTEENNKMKDFLRANPGIRSRINTTVYFDSYSPKEMLNIFLGIAKNNRFTVDKKAHGAILSFFEQREKEKDFGNGREARSLLENTTVEAARRIAKIPEEQLNVNLLKELAAEDVERAIRKMTEAFEIQSGQGMARCGFRM